MKYSNKTEIWFVVGSQHLYGPETLKQVEANAKHVVESLNATAKLPVPIVLKPMVVTPDGASSLSRDANHDTNCIGVIVWLHTFSPAKMWTTALRLLDKPLLQLHTQHNAEVPWSTMDMDFMNLNQTAHGGREFGFMTARLRKANSVAVGHWQDAKVINKLDTWSRVCIGIHDSRNMKIARFGDNMREVAVTEGDKVEAQIKFGYSVSAYGIGDLVKVVDAISEQQINTLIDEYESVYDFAPHVKKGAEQHYSVRDAAKIELGMRQFLQEGGFTAFTTNFENLYGLVQLPGLAVQRLMADGYGFGGEGDWKTAAFVRTVKAMATGLQPGTSFMEDYTYNFATGNDLVIGAHMLEVCPSIANQQRPLLDVQPLGIGGKADPARLIFSALEGPAINATIVDMGNRFRLLINEVNTVKQPHPLPKLPVARAVWQCKPNLDVAVEAWIVAGGAHHTVYSQAITTEHLRIFAEEMGIECLVIDDKTDLHAFKNEVRWNELYYGQFQK